jgi:hypothetical protein
MGSFKVHIIGVFGRAAPSETSLFFFYLQFTPVFILLFCSFLLLCECVCVCGISKWTLDLAADPDCMEACFFCLGGWKEVVVVGSDFLFHFSCLQLDHYLLIYKYIGGIWNTCTSAGILLFWHGEHGDNDISVHVVRI